MAFSVKQWLNRYGAGTAYDQPTDTGDTPDTPADAAGMRDLETRLSGYTDSELAAHTGDTTAAHAASAVSFAATGSVASTNAQAAIAEVASEANARLTSLESAQSGSDETVNTVAASGAAQTIPVPTTASLSRITLTANCTLTFPALAAGRSFSLVLKQDGTGSRTVTWPAIRWAGGDTEPTLTTTAGKEDWFTFASADGTTWAGFVVGQNV